MSVARLRLLLLGLLCFLFTGCGFFRRAPDVTPRVGDAPSPLDGGDYWQDLAQFEKGVARSTVKPWQSLARSDGTYQPETLIFTDKKSGAEIWRLDNDDADTSVPAPSNRSPWSADGSRLLLESKRCPPEVACGEPHDFLFDARGGSPRLAAPWSTGYVPWDRSRAPVYYVVTWNDSSSGAVSSTVYAVDTASGDATMKLADLPNPTRAKHFPTAPTEDDYLILVDENPEVDESGTPDYFPEIYVVDASVSRPTFGELVYHYPINFNLSFVGHETAEEYHLHDLTVRRNAADSFVLSYGSESGDGEGIAFEAPLDGTKAKIKLAYPDADNETPLYSHPAWSAGGSLVAYSAEDGVWVRDQDGHSSLARLGDRAEHLAWDGYDTRSLVFDGYLEALTFGLSSALADGTATRTLVTYPARDPSTTPPLGLGPAQSPDGTKVLFSMPNRFALGEKMHTYVAVDHRPIAPVVTVTSVSAARIAWTPYAAHHETNAYHVYRSESPDGDFREVARVPANTTSYSDGTTSLDQTHYYAVTAEETSGLESEALSNVVKITVGASWEDAHAAGITHFDQAPPDTPSLLSAAELEPGIWKLTWHASLASDVRYYDLYYATGGRPTATIPFLVASPLAGETEVIYWQASPTEVPYFGLTAIDRQGNASPMACVVGTSPSTPCP